MGCPSDPPQGREEAAGLQTQGVAEHSGPCGQAGFWRFLIGLRRLLGGFLRGLGGGRQLLSAVSPLA
jgi:hypothetical protein